MRNKSLGNSLKSLCAVAILFTMPAVHAAEMEAPSQQQVMLRMAYAANLSAGLTGESAEVSKLMAPRLNCFLGAGDTVKNQWTVVWGPEVVTKEHGGISCPVKESTDKVPANTMFVAKKGENTYVIAIAGTNPKSAYAWCQEDLNIYFHVWPYGHPDEIGITAVTLGTYNGLRELQRMSDPKQGSLMDFMTKNAAGATIYVTGHSLGGALAPALAQWLADTQDQWDRGSNGKATLQLFAFAGATPGDRAFAKYMDKTFPGEVASPLPTHPFAMVMVNNTLDVVPHAWNALSQIPNLYQAAGIAPSSEQLKVIEDLEVEVGFAKLLGWHYTTPGTAMQQASFTGKLQTREQLNDPRLQGTQCPPLAAFLTDPKLKKHKLDDFEKEALFQHLCAYPNQLDLPNLWLEMFLCESSQDAQSSR